MFAYLEGKFTFKSPAQVYIDVNGIGYEVNISLQTYSSLQQLEAGRLYTYLQIREDAQVLYGFFDRKEKDMFVRLIGISGVGAATARMMLSALRSEEIQKAIAQGNVKLLESIKGIGKKTAERLVLELKDKVDRNGHEAEMPAATGNSLQQDAIQALTALGIARVPAEQAVQKVIVSDPHITNLEELIKKALKVI